MSRLQPVSLRVVQIGCLLLAICLPVAGIDAQERCANGAVDVIAASSEERRIACSAASNAIRLLGRCEILPRRSLRVEIKSEVRHPLGRTVLGHFDTRDERVLVTQESNVPALVKHSPYARLPLRDFYSSLIVHEVVHGVMHQNMKRPAASHAAYEYPAYALQIESLAPDVRRSFLDPLGNTEINAGSAMFSDALLFFDPYFFAARAYQHFKASADACVRLVNLLENSVDFVVPPEM